MKKITRSYLFSSFLATAAIFTSLSLSNAFADEFSQPGTMQDYIESSCDDMLVADGIIVQLNDIPPVSSSSSQLPQAARMSASAQEVIESILPDSQIAVEKALTSSGVSDNGPLTAQASRIANNFDKTFIIYTTDKPQQTLEVRQNFVSLDGSTKQKRCAEINSTLQKLNADTRVNFAEMNLVLTLDDYFLNTSNSWGQGSDDLWGLKKINGDDAWATTEGEGVVVAVIDSGIDYNHPDLMENIWVGDSVTDANNDGKRNIFDLDTNSNGIIESSELYDGAIGFNTFTSDQASSNPFDLSGHGTHVAGTIAAIRGNNLGIVGVAPKAKIMPIRVFGANGSATITTITNGVLKAVELKADVTNNSYGGAGASQLLEDAFNTANNAGIVNIAAAGNEQRDALAITPARYTTTITVAACNQNSGRVSFSNYGTGIDVCAPGGGTDDNIANILSTMSDGTTIANARPQFRVPGNEGAVAQGYYRLAGTSMASPHVAGIAALLRAANPSLTPEDIRGILQYTADGVIDSPLYVSKMANATAALAAAVPMPVARFDAKQVNAFENGKFNLLGYAYGDNFSHFTISYGLGNNPSTWTQIKSSSTPVTKTNGILESNFDTGTLPDDTITLRLQTFDTLGRFVEDRVNFIVSNLKVTNPQANDVVRYGDVLEVRADMNVANITSYKLDYVVTEQEVDEDAWTSSALESIENTPSGRNVLIGRLNTNLLQPEQFYNLRLSITLADGSIRSFMARLIYLSSQLKTGYPIRVSYPKLAGLEDLETVGDQLSFQEIIVEDLDNDGSKEIVTFAESTLSNSSTNATTPLLQVYNNDGSLRWSQPIVRDDYTYKTLKVTDFLIADLNGDGFREIVFSTISDTLSNTFQALKHDGTPLEGWPVTIPGNYLFRHAASIDLDRDGKDELIMPAMRNNSYNGGISIINGGGVQVGQSDIPNRCYQIGFGLKKSILAIGNLDGDPQLEIIYINGCDELVIANHDGSTVQGWPKKFGPGEIDYLTLADFNGDGIDEIVFARSAVYTEQNAGIYVINNAGEILPGWPIEVPKLSPDQPIQFNSQPSVGDLNGDGSLDIVLTCNYCNPRFIVALGINGQTLPGWPISLSDSPKLKRFAFGEELMNQMLADVDNDGYLDVVLSGGGLRVESIRYGQHAYSGGIFAFNRFGSLIDLNPHPDIDTLLTETRHPLLASTVTRRMPPVITDLDNDGILDVITSVSRERRFQTAPGRLWNKDRGSIYAWSLQTPDLPGRVAWGLPFGGSGNSGSANPPAKVPVVKLAAPDYTLTRRHDTYYLNVKDIPPGARQLVAEVIQQRVQRRGRQIIGRETLRSASRVVTSLDGSKTSLSLVGRMKIDRAFRGGYLSFYYIDAQGNRGEVSGLRGLVGAWNHPRAARTAEVVIRQMGNLRTYEPTARRRRR